MSTIRLFLKDTVLYGIASVMPRIVSFLLVGLYTSVFTARDFSGQTKWYVYAAFLNALLTMGLETSFFRFYSMRTKDSSSGGGMQAYDKNQVLAVSFFTLLTSSVLFMLVAWLFGRQLTDFFGFGSSVFLQILVAVTVLDTLVVIPFALLRSENKSLRFLWLKLINITVLAVATFLLLYIIPRGAGQWSVLCVFPDCLSGFEPQVIHILYANLLASAVTCVMVLPEFRRIPWPSDGKLLLGMLRYSWPVMVAGIAYIVNENLDKLLIAYWAGEEANGIYAACYKLGVFMTLYITAFRLGAEPFFFSNAHHEDATRKYSTIMTWFVWLGTVFMLAVMVHLDSIASVFLRQEVYMTGLEIVPLLLLANLFSGIYATLGVWYKLSDKTAYGMILSVAGGVLTCITLWLMVPVWGITGGALSTLTTYFLMAASSWYLGRKVYPIPYETGRIMGMILLSFGASLLCYYVFRDDWIIKWAILLLYIAMTIGLQKKEFQLFIKGDI